MKFETDSLCAVVFLLLTQLAVDAARECTRNSKLYLLSLLPYPDDRPNFQPSWDEGPPLIIAEDLAVDLINDRTDILRDYCLELIRGDSGCDIRTTAVIAFAEHVLRTEPRVAGIVGPGCSTSSVTVSPLSGVNKIALINVHVAGSLLLEDRERYPYSFGTLDSTEVFVETAIALMRKNDWTDVAAFYDESRVYYYSTLQAFQKEVQNLSDYRIALSSAVYDTFFPFDVLMQVNVRIVFLLVGPDLLSKILCLAYHLKLVFPVYQWIIVSRTAEEVESTAFSYNGKFYSCNDDELKTAVNGSIIMHYKLKPQDLEASTEVGQNISYVEFDNTYSRRIEDFNSHSNSNLTVEPSFWAPSYFDAVWSLALAMNNSIPLLDEMGLSLTEYGFGQQIITDVIRNELLQLSFNGVSGRINFKPESGYVDRAVDVYQVDAGSMDLVAYHRSGEINITQLSHAHFVNGSFDSYMATPPLPAAIVFMIIAVIGFLLTAMTHTLTVAFRKHKCVRASSPKESHFAFIGCYLIITAIFSYIALIMDTAASKRHCILNHLVFIAFGIGFTLVLATICVKTWRLYRIFVHFINPGRLISDWVLTTVILLLTVISLIICIAWITVDPFKVSVMQNFTTVDETPVLEITIVCKQSSYFTWFGTLLGYNSALMVCALWLAVLTRHNRNRNFSTRSVVVLVYTLAVSLGLGLPLYFIMQVLGLKTLEFVVMCVLLSGIVYFCLVLLFLPPLLPVIRVKVIQFYHSYRIDV